MSNLPFTRVVTISLLGSLRAFSPSCASTVFHSTHTGNTILRTELCLL